MPACSGLTGGMRAFQVIPCSGASTSTMTCNAVFLFFCVAGREQRELGGQRQGSERVCGLVRTECRVSASPHGSRSGSSAPSLPKKSAGVICCVTFAGPVNRPAAGNVRFASGTGSLGGFWRPRMLSRPLRTSSAASSIQAALRRSLYQFFTLHDPVDPGDDTRDDDAECTKPPIFGQRLPC